ALHGNEEPRDVGRDLISLARQQVSVRNARLDPPVHRVDVGSRCGADDGLTRRRDTCARTRRPHSGSTGTEDANGAGGLCNPHAGTSVATVMSTASRTSMPASRSAASIVSGGNRRTTVSLV